MGLTLALGAARGLHMAGSYALFGTLLLAALFGRYNAALRRLAWGSLAVALGAGLAWFLLQAADMASAGNFAEMVAALPIVTKSTRFGHLAVLRGLLLLLASLCFAAGRKRVAALSGGLAVIAEAWLDHGGAMTSATGTVLLLSDIVHLGSGAAWLGSLPALFLMLARLPLDEAARLARRYSPLGIACVAALVASAAVQFFLLVGSPAALLGSAYGRVALLKILLLAGLVLLAALNRHRLAPALAAGRAGSRTKILCSIGGEIALGLLALLAAGVLLNLTPPRMAAMLRLQ